MSFQMPGGNAPPTGGFSFGTPTTTAPSSTAKPSGFTFGATGGGDAGIKPLVFFGSAAPAAASVAAAPATSTATGGSTLGLSAAGTTTGFGFGTPASTATTVQPVATSFGSSSAANPVGGFSLGTTTTVTSAVASSTSIATSTTTAASLTGGFPLYAAATVTTAAAPTAVGTATTTVSSVLASQTPAATASSAPATTGFASLTTATKTTDSSAMPSIASQLSYNQLEEHINKWTLELEEQEKVFTDQATQINAWDKILISNNQKILDLNDAVQKVKSDQQTLEQELEFIATQHKELEESIMPLQKEFMKIPQVDVERSQTYLMVENLDTQLKQMSEDLKEIIDNLNESNKCQDNSDPIIQIGKILNAHMSSLQWIEQSTTAIGNKLEDITKMHETFKRDSERSFRSAYYN